MRLPPLRRSATALQAKLTPSLRRSASVLSSAMLQHGVLGLKIAAGALAAAIVALVNQQFTPQTVPIFESAFETAGNETVVYRQAAARPSYVQAEVSDTLADDEEDAAPHHPRTVKTVRFLNPAKETKSKAAAVTGETIPESLRGLFDPQAMLRVGGFVAFPAKETAEPDGIASRANLAVPRKRDGGFMDEVDDYLWEVYQRMPVKRDSSGDFSWKDPAAAERAGMSLQDYVIGGMDPRFREKLFHAGRAMDAAGIQWSILSAFRDDYRQRLAAGFKASVGNSLHGGSRRTGGYGHGRAIDITNAEGNPEAVWDWIDEHGSQYGLRRPMPGPDPAHIQQTGEAKIVVATHKRLKSGSKMKRRHAAAKKIKLARASH